MRISDWSSDVCSSDLQSGIVAPSFVGGRDHAQLHRELAEVPVRAAADDLPVLVHLGGGAPGDGGLACGGDAEEILVMRGFPYPLHISPFVVVEIGAEIDIVREAAIVLLVFALPFLRDGALALNAARCAGRAGIGRAHV